VSHEIAPRRMPFDRSRTPLHRIPGEPTATHVGNVLHLLPPAGERGFVKVFEEHLPLVGDPGPRAAVKGLLPGERSPLDPPIPARAWLRLRLSVVAAAERLTAVLGDWIPAADGLDRAGADEVMLHLLRRHGAEETEHRAVAFDMHQHCGGTGTLRCARRIAGTAVTAPVTPYLRVWGAAYLMRHGPQTAGRPRHSLKEHDKTARKGLLPAWQELGAAVPRHLRRPYHPSREGSLSTVTEHLKRSPAARAAA
jgi:predicted metal-dependent hydrolase